MNVIWGNSIRLNLAVLGKGLQIEFIGSLWFNLAYNIGIINLFRIYISQQISEKMKIWKQNSKYFSPDLFCKIQILPVEEAYFLI